MMERLVRDELLWLLRAFGSGALLALLYDVEQTLCAPLQRAVRKLWDVLFLLGCTLWLFGVCLRCHGELRLSFFLALALGCLFYGRTVRKSVKRALTQVEKLEVKFADRVNGFWKKIQNSVKKCFSKWKNSYTIGLEKAREKRRSYEEKHEHGDRDTAPVAAQSADALAVRTVYSAERVGRKSGGGGTASATGERSADTNR